MERISLATLTRSNTFTILVIDVLEHAMRSSMRVFLLRIEQDTGTTLKIGQMVKFQKKEMMSMLNQDGPWFSI
jgi:hypothetical protein